MQDRGCTVPVIERSVAEQARRNHPKLMIALNKLAAGLTGPLALGLSILLLALAVFVLARRGYRHLHFSRLDKARAECGPVIQGMLAGSIEISEGSHRFRTLVQGRPLAVLETLLTARKNPSLEQAAILARLCEEAGLVARWQARLADTPAGSPGRSGKPRAQQCHWLQRMRPLNFALRVRAAENLGLIRHRSSWPLLVEALRDRHSLVRSAAARALGRIHEPESFPALVQQLESSAAEPAPKISVRSLKMALGGFQLAQAGHLLPLLESSHPRVRFLAADVISELAEREAADRSEHGRAHGGFSSQIADISLTPSALTEASRAADGDRDESPVPPEIAPIFLTRLRLDANPDVRARAADVIGWMKADRASPALSELSEDPEWFVRLHAVRALAHQSPSAIEAFARRLTDPHWRVREAATQALCAQGRAGFDRLLEHFLSTEDRYSQEQVAEQFERAGLISSNFLQVLSDLETRAIPKASLGPEVDSGALGIAQRNAIRARKRELLLQELAVQWGRSFQPLASAPASFSEADQRQSRPAARPLAG